MTKEIIFNFFPICNLGLIMKFGYVIHEMEGTDQYKIDFLLENVKKDAKIMKFIGVQETSQIIAPSFTINGVMTIDLYENLSFNQITALFESVFIAYNAPSNPLFVSTIIADGKLKERI
jgi:hypothetical protein